MTLLMSCGSLDSPQSEPTGTDTVIRVAIIGAGIGGAFFSDSLRSLLANQGQSVAVDVFESSGRVGGRVLDTSAFGEESPVELGASMFIDHNTYIASAAASLGLPTESRAAATKAAGRLLLLGAAGTPTFTEGRFSATNLWQLATRFGVGHIRRLKGRGREFISNFSRIYEAQRQGVAAASVGELLGGAGLAGWPFTNCSEAMSELLGSPTAAGAARPDHNPPTGSSAAQPHPAPPNPRSQCA